MSDRKRTFCPRCSSTLGTSFTLCRCGWREPFTPDEIRAAEIEAAREEGRREALAHIDRIMIGGNHLASALIHILGADDASNPPYTTNWDDATTIIGDPIKADLWTCWAVMMRERDAIEAKTKEAQ